MIMNRRSLLKTLCALPFVGLIKPTPTQILRVDSCGSVSYTMTTFNDNEIEHDGYDSMVASINVTPGMTREEINELGRRGPYFKWMEM